MTEQPPICDYEGSDYQDVFWDTGGRAYEDAVEAVALRRLLPAGGERLLELGAGAGRNTPRYRGFQQVTLLDYSRSQLERARDRLGDSPDYRYVAADACRLPFAPGVFSAATMIRTLHHLTQPEKALAQASAALQPGAVFILEYANKRNVKAVLRYLLRRQAWNPFSREPVEFVRLNFDFHPAAVRDWLHACGFRIERQLTVSHFRIGLLKRLAPLRLLVAMDALAQLTGDLWQYTPSVFVRAVRIQSGGAVRNQSGGAVRNQSGGAFFACPACQALLEDTPPRLLCPGCDRVYPVEGGIYDFRLE